MKVCTHCKNPKLLTAFAKRAASKDGLASWCKECFAENAREKFQSSEEERERKRQNRKNQRDRNHLLILEYLSSHPCVDCGENDIRVLEFDHRDEGQKSFNISDRYSTYSWKRLAEEIAKCDIRCANHHRIRTWERANTWRSRIGV